MPENQDLAHGENPPLEEFILPVWRERKRILLVSLAVGLLVYGGNFLLGDYFKVTATLLPAPEKGRLSALGQFAEVAALAGVNVPGSEVARLYPTIITSESVLRKAIQRLYPTADGRDVNLLEYFDLTGLPPDEAFELAVKQMRSELNTTYDARTGIVNLTYVMDDPVLASAVVNAVIEELDHLMRSKKTSNASDQVQWIEARLVQVEDSLRIAEEAFKAFREKNRRVSDSPHLLLEQERLFRVVQVSSTVFTELKKQYELAKLEEIKNMSIVNVLDHARPPVLKAGPKRKTNGAIAFMVALFCGSAFVALRAVYGRQITEYLGMLRSNKERR